MNRMPTTPFANAGRALAAVSPALDSSVATVVCIPAFRRPKHLRATLDSLAKQRSDRPFAVVIVDNDAMASESVPVAREFLEPAGFRASAWSSRNRATATPSTPRSRPRSRRSRAPGIS